MQRTDIRYLDLELRIERAGEGYRAHVPASPAGQASANFTLPFSDLELASFRLRIERPRRGVRRVEASEMEAVKSFGGDLFDAVFRGDVLGCLRRSLDEADRQEKTGVRIRLNLAGAPELADLPWEYLYHRSRDHFLSLSIESPLVRYLDLPERIQPLVVKPPLRVLVMISSPADYEPLDVEREWQELNESLHELQQCGLVALHRLAEPTLPALQRELRREECHVFHFIGHGGFTRADEGVLVLEDTERRAQVVRAHDLGAMLHDEPLLRLAIIDVVGGARSSRSDPFSGTAQSLVQRGIPAVIAMQFEITDRAAVTFSHEFYTALAEGYPVDAALGEARKMIYNEGNELEWGTPVLYMRSPDGRIFDFEVAALPAPAPASLPQVSEEEREELYAAGRQQQEAGRLREALEHFVRVRDLGGSYRDVEARIAGIEQELKAQEEAQAQREQELRAREEAERKKQREQELKAQEEAPEPDTDSAQLPPSRNQIFISYSRSDRKWLERLRVHLKPLESSGTITLWDDTRIKPGSNWRQEIERALNSARVAILLVSADFLASDFINTNELPPLLKAAAEEGVVILPVIVSPSWYQAIPSLSQFQAVNPLSKPLIEMRKHQREALFVEVAAAIEEALEA